MWPNNLKTTERIYLNTWHKTLSYSDGQYLEDIESPNVEEITYEELLRHSKKVII